MRIQFEDKMKSNPLVVLYLPLIEELCLENLRNKLMCLAHSTMESELVALEKACSKAE